MEGVVSSDPFRGAFRRRRVIVTGHTGFKGAWLTRWLQLLGADVLGISLPATDSPNLFQDLRLELADHRFDIADAHRTAAALRAFRPDVVFHLAAQSLVGRGYDAPLETFRTNVQGTAAVLDAVRGLDSVRSVVVATSDKCYRNDDSGRAFLESDPLGGIDPYSASKAGAEMVVGAYRALPGMPVLTSVRAGNVVGGGDWAEKRLVPDMVRALQRNATAALRSPSSRRPWQHVLDCLAGYLTIAQRHLQGPPVADTYNFGPDAAAILTVRELADLVIAAWGSGRWEVAPEPLRESAVLALDSSQARRDLGWRPVFEIGDAIHESVRWYREASTSEAKALCDSAIADYAMRARVAGAHWAVGP